MDDEEYDLDAELELEELLALDRQSMVTSAASTMYRAPSQAATTTIVHLHQPRERRGNVILYDKTPTTSFSFLKVQ